MITAIPLGGGDEIGASCMMLFFKGMEDTAIFVDSGGRPLNFTPDIGLISQDERTTPEKEQAVFGDDIILAKSPWPKFSLIPKGLKRAIILVTHGHFDHVGGLLALIKHLLRENPGIKIKIYWSRGTRDLAFHQWRDMVARDQSLPFSSGEIMMISRLKMTEELVPTEDLANRVPITDELSISPIKAGHILGATSYFFFYRRECVGVVFGDLCYHNQRTVPGAPKLALDGLGFMMIDSTKLTEKNPPREEVEKQAKACVRKALSEGKSVRIPTFSIGRTQEADALVQEVLQEFPSIKSYIEGAGRDISRIYLAQLRDRMDPHITRRFVQDQERWRIIKNEEPNVVIIPSAMQFGGHAKKYAMHDLGRSDRLYISFGWLSPCSPEFAFFEATDKYPTFRFGNYAITRFCEVARFSLTAHLDGAEVLETADRLKPQKIVMYHGSSERMDEFRDAHPEKPLIKATNFKELSLA